jgi:HSP20 family molecular chaperone IbpA
MSTKYVRVVPSSETAGSSLSGEITQAFERIRERAYTIYDSRSPDAPGSEYEDWLRAERELFEVPDVEIQDEGEEIRLSVSTEAAVDRPLTIAVEPTQVTLLGHRMADGQMNLFRLVNLPGPVDPARATAEVRRGAGVQIVLSKPGVPDRPQSKTRAAAVGREVVAV